jgi:hypothetical protein
MAAAAERGSVCVQLTARKGNGVAAAEGEEVKSRSRVGNQMRAADWWGGSRRCGSRRGGGRAWPRGGLGHLGRGPTPRCALSPRVATADRREERGGRLAWAAR